MAQQFKTVDQMWERGDFQALNAADKHLSDLSIDGWSVVDITVQIDTASTNKDYSHRVVTLCRSTAYDDGIPF